MRNRHCIVINTRQAVAIVLIFICNGIRHSETAGGNQMASDELKNESVKSNNNNMSENESIIPTFVKWPIETNGTCTGYEDEPCENLDISCIYCNYNYSCLYGRDLNVTCTVHEQVRCLGDRSFQRQMNCRYCYQTEMWQQTCSLRGNCKLMTEPYYRTNCTVHPNVLCLGTRVFPRNMRCNWTQGHRWSTALIISLTLGGFGADRFYLGHWQEGIGKLFSFGGLGVWTIIDVLLISLHYLGPADGSLYI